MHFCNAILTRHFNAIGVYEILKKNFCYRLLMAIWFYRKSTYLNQVLCLLFYNLCKNIIACNLSKILKVISKCYIKIWYCSKNKFLPHITNCVSKCRFVQPKYMNEYTHIRSWSYMFMTLTSKDFFYLNH